MIVHLLVLLLLLVASPAWATVLVTQDWDSMPGAPWSFGGASTTIDASAGSPSGGGALKITCFQQTLTQFSTSCGRAEIPVPGALDEVWFGSWSKWSTNWAWHPIATKYDYIFQQPDPVCGHNDNLLLANYPGSIGGPSGGLLPTAQMVWNHNNPGSCAIPGTYNMPIVQNFQFVPGNWYWIQHHVKAGGAGACNGIYEQFVGTASTGVTVRVVYEPNLCLRSPNSAAGWSIFQHSLEYGGSGPATIPADQYQWRDHFVMATTQAETNMPGGAPPTPDTTPPTQVTGLTVTAVSSTQNNLAWSASSDNVGVIGYQVERCAGAGCTNFSALQSVQTTSYQNTIPAADTSSYFHTQEWETRPGAPWSHTSPSIPSVACPPSGGASPAGGCALVMNLAAGTYGTSQSGGISEYAFSPGLTEFYAGHWVKFSTPYSWNPIHNKIDYIFGDNGAGGLCSTSIKLGSGGSPLVTESTCDPSLVSNNMGTLTISPGTWYWLEIHAIANTPGVSNGTLEIWVDGALYLRYTNRRFRETSAGFVSFKHSPEWGGSGGTIAQNQFIAFDHTILSTARIGSPQASATLYRYRVRAVDAAGNLGPYSQPADVTTLPDGSGGGGGTGPITYNGLQSADCLSASSCSASVTVASGNNRVLAVVVYSRHTNNTNAFINTVSYGGVNLTKINDVSVWNGVDTNMRASIWRLIAPTVGTATLAITASGSSEYLGFSALPLYGVDQTVPVDADATGSSLAGAALSATVTTQTAHALILDGALGRDDLGLTVGAGQTMLRDIIVAPGANTDGWGVSVVDDKATPGAEAMNWTQAGAVPWVLTTAAFRPVSATPTGPPTITGLTPTTKDASLTFGAVKPDKVRFQTEFGSETVWIADLLTKTIVASDSLDRADGAIGADYTTISGSSAVQISSLMARVPALATNTGSVRNDTLGNDQWVSMGVRHFTGTVDQYLVPLLRFDPATTSGYACVWGRYGGNPYLAIERWDGGVHTVLASLPYTNLTYFSIGMTCEGIQQTIYLRIDGRVVLTATDSTYASGKAGVFLYVDVAGNAADLELHDLIFGSHSTTGTYHKPPISVTRATTLSDNFNRANGTIGANYTSTGASFTSTAADPFEINGNGLRMNSSAHPFFFSNAISTTPFTGNRWMQLTFTSTGSAGDRYFALCAFCTANFGGYMTGGGRGTYNYQETSLVDDYWNNAVTTINGYYQVPADPFTLRMEVIRPFIRTYVNDVLVHTATDDILDPASFPYVGWAGWVDPPGTSADLLMDDFSAGTFSDIRVWNASETFLCAYPQDSAGNENPDPTASRCNTLVGLQVTDTTSPGMSNLSPTGELASNITTATLLVTTDEFATVRADTVDQAYGTMSLQLDTLDGLHHFKDVSVSAGNSYTYYFRARDGNVVPGPNISTVSSSTSFSVAAIGGDTTAPTPPTNVTCVPVSPSQATCTWVAGTDNVAIGVYNIWMCSLVGCSSYSQLFQTGPGTSLTLPGLASSTFYSLYIVSQDLAGNISTNSNTTTFTTPSNTDQEPPSDVSGFAAATPLWNSISLSWTIGTDNVSVVGTILERCSGAGCTDFMHYVTTPNSQDFVDTSVLPSTAYRYRAKHIDGAGNVSSNYSVTITATTPSVPADVTRGTCLCRRNNR
jgi:hypothetical protein